MQLGHDLSPMENLCGQTSYSPRAPPHKTIAPRPAAKSGSAAGNENTEADWALTAICGPVFPKTLWMQN